MSNMHFEDTQNVQYDFLGLYPDDLLTHPMSNMHFEDATNMQYAFLGLCSYDPVDAIYLKNCFPM